MKLLHCELAKRKAAAGYSGARETPGAITYLCFYYGMHIGKANIPLRKEKIENPLVMEGRKAMAYRSRTANKMHLFIFSALTAVGIVFLVAALFQPKAAEPPGWTALNEQVDNTLGQLLRSDGAQSETAVAGSGTIGQAGAQSIEAAGTGGTAGAGTSGPGMTEPAAGVSGSEESGAGGGGQTKIEKAGAVVAGSEDSGASAGASDGRVDINRASAEELDKLPGIGMAKAQTIIDDREKNGPFRSADDLLRVKGIGPKLLEKMKPSIVAIP
jgi:competence protein ComEA